MRVRAYWYAAQKRFAEAEAQYRETIKVIFEDSSDMAGLPYVLLGLAEVWQHSDRCSATLSAMLVIKSHLTWASDRINAQRLLDALLPIFSTEEWQALEQKATETSITAYAESLLQPEKKLRRSTRKLKTRLSASIALISGLQRSIAVLVFFPLLRVRKFDGRPCLVDANRLTLDEAMVITQFNHRR